MSGRNRLLRLFSAIELDVRETVQNEVQDAPGQHNLTLPHGNGVCGDVQGARGRVLLRKTVDVDFAKQMESSKGVHYIRLRRRASKMDAPYVWSKFILSRFAAIPANPSVDNDYYAPYNKLLYSLFHPDGPFAVAVLPITGSGSTGSFWEFQVRWVDVVVFILEIRMGSKLGLMSERKVADFQIRKRLGDLVDDFPLPKLHAVSAFGTKLCFYSIEPGHAVTPPRIVSDGQLIIDTAPIGRWNYDVLEDGAARLKAIADEIHQFCAQLAPSKHIICTYFS